MSIEYDKGAHFVSIGIPIFGRPKHRGLHWYYEWGILSALWYHIQGTCAYNQSVV